MPDPWIALSAIAARTKTIRLGTSVTPVARRQPWQVARDLATLDRLSGGRVILGAGLGRRPDYEQFGYPWSLKWSAARTDEALSIVNRLWTGNPVTHEGEHFQLTDVVLLPTSSCPFRLCAPYPGSSEPKQEAPAQPRRFDLCGSELSDQV